MRKLLMMLAICLLSFVSVSAQAVVDCPIGEPTRLISSGMADVISEDGAMLHFFPNGESETIIEVETGTRVLAWFGPACMEDGVWWLVNVDSKFGWMQESVVAGDGYLLEPFGDSADDLPMRPRAGDDGLTVEGLGISFDLSANVAGLGAVEWRTPIDEGPQIFHRPLYRRAVFQGYVGTEQEFWIYINVYPVQAWEDVTGILMDDLRELLAERPEEPVMAGLPEINAALALVAREAYIDFQNGSGVRSIVRYTQAPIPPADGDLIYFFAGLTDDEQYLVHVAFALDSVLIPNNDVMYELFNFEQSMDYFELLYTTLDAMIMRAPDEAFYPRLSDVDALVESLFVGDVPEFCGDVPSLLAIDDTVEQVLEVDPLRVRVSPNGEVIDEFLPDEEAVVVDGPECVNGVVWWQVIRVDEWVGWVAELQGDSYYLMRVND